MPPPLSPLRVLTLVATLAAAGACTVLAQPLTVGPPIDVKVWTTFNGDDWAHVLATMVDAQGRVDYPSLKANRTSLDRYVAILGEVGPTTRPELFNSSAQQLAYYLNAYNALTLFNVVNRWPAIRSVMDERASFFVLTKFKLDGAQTNLYDLENNIIRPRFKEPRVHFALNCASGGCPQLPRVPFDAATLPAQLQREAVKFVHEARNVSVAGDTVTVSNIFTWYQDDFGGDVLAYVHRVAPDLTFPVAASVVVRDYDWALNAQPSVQLKRSAP